MVQNSVANTKLISSNIFYSFAAKFQLIRFKYSSFNANSICCSFYKILMVIFVWWIRVHYTYSYIYLHLFNIYIYTYVYVYICMSVCVCVCIIINSSATCLFISNEITNFEIYLFGLMQKGDVLVFTLLMTVRVTLDGKQLFHPAEGSSGRVLPIYYTVIVWDGTDPFKHFLVR